MRNMGTSWRRRSVSKTSILACVILFIAVVALVAEAYPAKGWKQKRRHHGSSAHRRSVAAQKPRIIPRPMYNGRGVYLKDAMNLTLCSYRVQNNVEEGRVPKTIPFVTCVKNGCRCRTVGDTGTYTCTQLLTDMLVTINSVQEKLTRVPYACVCASKSGNSALESSPEGMLDDNKS